MIVSVMLGATARSDHPTSTPSSATALHLIVLMCTSTRGYYLWIQYVGVFMHIPIVFSFADAPRCYFAAGKRRAILVPHPRIQCSVRARRGATGDGNGEDLALRDAA